MNQMPYTSLSIAAVICTTVLGCTPAAYRAETSICMPASWQSIDPMSTALPTAGATHEQLAKNSDNWWSFFDDPALDLLLTRAIANNLDLRSATIDVLTATTLQPLKIETLRQQRLSLISTVASCYVELRTALLLLPQAEELIALNKQIIALKQKLLDRGLIGEGELSLLNGELAALQAELPALQQTVIEMRYRLLGLMGTYPQEQLPPIATGPLPLPQESIAIPSPAELLRRQPDLRAAERLWAMNRNGVASIITHRIDESTAESAVNGHSQLPPLDIAGVAAEMCHSSAQELQSHYRFKRVVLEACERLATSAARYSLQQHAYRLCQQAVTARTLEMSYTKELQQRGLANQLAIALNEKAVVESQKTSTLALKDLLLTYVEIESSFDSCQELQ
jgi:outer membrane protein TolC